MILKKQTIWLLTMLSLIVVLSVYYVQTPTPSNEVAFIADEEEDAANVDEINDSEEYMDIDEALEDDGEKAPEPADEEEQDGSEDEESAITSITSSDVFTTLRMELQASRDRLAEEYTQIVAAEDTTAQMKSEAHDNNLNLIRLAQNEATLETLIKAKGYEDALVMAEEDEVQIIVQAEELSRVEANDILRMAFDRLGKNLNVAVSHEVPK